MSKIEFYIKYIFRTEKGGYANWRFYFPLLGVAFGVLTVILTFAIMQGMENEVFNKLKAINFSSKVLDNNFEKPENQNFNYIINKKAIIFNGGDYRVINVKAIENFQMFKTNSLSEFMIDSSSVINGAVLGKSLATKLSVGVGDYIELVSPDDVSFLTGIPTSAKLVVSGIFRLNLLNYDDQYIFTDLSIGETLFKSAQKEVYSDLTPTQIKLKHPNVSTIETWKEEHIDFISAMNLEKLAFSSFGFLIILLSAFSSFSIMCVTVVRRVSEIGILRALGFSKNMIAKIYFSQSLLIGLLGGLFGIILSKIFIELDKANNLITHFFSSEILFDFELKISNSEIFIIYFIGLFIMLFAGIYPSIYASRIPIMKSLNYNK
ncbi:MAG: ABC transporter permease [Candidatus Marinimicrobia bacterium]|nr:ABC transporter permease [Candidatus Neomarinimicrobiota bacterium]